MNLLGSGYQTVLSVLQSSLYYRLLKISVIQATTLSKVWMFKYALKVQFLKNVPNLAINEPDWNELVLVQNHICWWTVEGTYKWVVQHARGYENICVSYFGENLQIDLSNKC